MEMQERRKAFSLHSSCAAMQEELKQEEWKESSYKSDIEQWLAHRAHAP